MGNYRIVTLGTAEVGTSVKNNKYLRLRFKEGVFENISKEDFESKIYIMLEDNRIVGLMPKDYDLFF